MKLQDYVWQGFEIAFVALLMIPAAGLALLSGLNELVIKVGTKRRKQNVSR